MKKKKNKKGLLIVVSAPAGCGKDTILDKVLAECPNLHYSVSVTTRKKREGEAEGISYYFRTTEEFKKMLEEKELLEYTEYVGNYYGTPKTAVYDMLESGRDVILKIEVEGAGNIKKLFPDCVMIFIVPPSFTELERRLKKRGSEDEATIKNRIDAAKIELTFIKHYDYVIINNELDKAVDDFKTVVEAEKLAVRHGIPSIS